MDLADKDPERNRPEELEPKPPKPLLALEEAGYTLTPGEHAVLMQYNQSASNAKVKVHDLNVELEKAQKQVFATQEAFTAIITLLAQTHGMQNARLTPDMRRIVPQ